MSFPRANSFSYASPFALPLVSSSGKAVAKVFNTASLKLFGNPSDGILLRRPSSKKSPLPKAELEPEEVGSIFLVGKRMLTVLQRALIAELEDIGQKATVVFDFADSKLVQLLPPTPQTTVGPSNTSYHFPSTSGTPSQQQIPASPFGSGPQRSAGRTSSHSSLDRIVEDEAPCAAAVALVLYIKALGFLQRGIEKARTFWDAKVAISSTSSASPEFNEGET